MKFHTLGILSLVSSLAHAEVFHSREEALKLAFPTADRIERKNLFLGDKQVEEAERIAEAKLASRIFTVYAGYKGQRILGHAFIETHRVRTLPETFLLVLSPNGQIQRIVILAFHEPPEYRPPPRWLKQFEGQRAEASRGLPPVAGIAGATLSARAITAATSRLVTIHRLLGLQQPAAPITTTIALPTATVVH